MYCCSAVPPLKIPSTAVCVIAAQQLWDQHHLRSTWWGTHPLIQNHFVNAPSQWETTLQCNVVSHWLGAFTKWTLPIWIEMAVEYRGLGVTKAPFVNFSITRCSISDFVKYLLDPLDHIHIWQVSWPLSWYSRENQWFDIYIYIHIQDIYICLMNYTSPYLNRNDCRTPGMGVTEPISPVPLFSHFFRIIDLLGTYWISRSYLTGVSTPELRWHLPNLNAIERIYEALFVIIISNSSPSDNIRIW